MRRCAASGMSSKPTTETSPGTERPSRSSRSISAIAITSLVQQTAVAPSSCGTGSRPRRRSAAASASGRRSTDSSCAPEWAKAMRSWPRPVRCSTTCSIAAYSSTWTVPRRASRPSNDTTTTGTPRSSSSDGIVDPAVTAGKMTPSTRRPTSARTWADSVAGSFSVSATSTAKPSRWARRSTWSATVAWNGLRASGITTPSVRVARRLSERATSFWR